MTFKNKVPPSADVSNYHKWTNVNNIQLLIRLRFRMVFCFCCFLVLGFFFNWKREYGIITLAIISTDCTLSWCLTLHSFFYMRWSSFSLGQHKMRTPWKFASLAEVKGELSGWSNCASPSPCSCTLWSSVMSCWFNFTGPQWPPCEIWLART